MEIRALWLFLRERGGRYLLCKRQGEYRKMKNAKRKITSILLALSLIIGLFAGLPMAASADEGIQAGLPAAVTVGVGDRLDIGDNNGPALVDVTKIGFDGRTWDVIGYFPQGGTYTSSTVGTIGDGVVAAVDMPEGSMTLLLDAASANAYSQFDRAGSSNVYFGSALQAAMDRTYSGITNNNEKALVINRTLVSQNYGGNFTDFNVSPYFDNVNCDGAVETG
jgi:hypothetical protein